MMSCPSNTPSANAKIEPGQYGLRTSYPPLQKTGLNLSPKTEWQITTLKNTYVQSCYYEGELNTYPDREGIETLGVDESASLWVVEYLPRPRADSDQSRPHRWWDFQLP